MDRNTFDALQNDALKSLRERRLSDLLSDIEGILSGCAEAWTVRESLEKLREEYGFMLGYMEQGVKDEKRGELYCKFLSRADDLLARAQHAFVSTADSSYFSTLAHRPNEGSDMESVFNRTLVSSPYDEAEAGRILMALENPNTPEALRLTLVSSITLSALCVFDKRKIWILGALMKNANVYIRSRAAVGFVLACIVHGERLARNVELKDIAKRWENDKNVRDLLRIVQIQLFVCSNTKRDSRKMRDEIIPGMMKAMKDKPLPEGIISLDDVEAELNPDWDMMNGDSEMSKHFGKLLKMQEYGADTFYTSFSSLMRHHPFWNDAANWFMPFSRSHKAFADNEQTCKLIDTVSPIFSQHTNISDTDKFSFIFMLSSLPTGNMTEQIKEQLAALDNFPPEKDSGEAGLDVSQLHVIRNYMHDLYRFFSLFRFPLPCPNPFDSEIMLHKTAFFTSLRKDKELTHELACYAFRDKDFQRADEYFQLLPPETLEAHDYEMWASALYNLRQYDEAAEYLERALLIQPQSVWALRLLSSAYVRSAQYDEALRVLNDWEHIAPDDVSMIQSMGECYVRLSKPQQALDKFFKLHYLRPDNRSRRAIAWCSMLTGKTEQASEYYTKLLLDSPIAEDYMNAAHCQLIMGNQKEAINLYRSYLRTKGEEFAASDFFTADKSLLLSNGLTETDLLLLRDVINQKPRT